MFYTNVLEFANCNNKCLKKESLLLIKEICITYEFIQSFFILRCSERIQSHPQIVTVAENFPL